LSAAQAGLFAMPAPDGAPARRIRLAGPADFEGFRMAARSLLARGCAPDMVEWDDGDAPGGGLLQAALAAEDAGGLPAPDATAPRPHVPAEFLALCASVALHADPARFALMYRLLWRLAREPGLRHDPLDAQMMRARQMAGAVRRDIHKMRAFVRFRPVESGQGTTHVAWFEPEHHIVEANAPFFARRFANMRWAILTPRCSVQWLPEGAGRGRLETGPGARREEAPGADDGEALWLTYYSRIFNPARLKMGMMQKEMPRKYWKNLPEAELIGTLAAQAETLTGSMIEAPATPVRPGMRTLSPKFAAKTATVIPLREVNSLAQLRAAVQACRDCPIGAHATQAVAGEGPHAPALMFVGEQPGDQEDLQGRPFVGPAGQLFDRALRELGVARDSVYLANAVKHFKYELRGKRRLHKTASQREAAACLHWLEREIELVAPKRLVALGATAARALLGRDVAVTRERGQWLARADGRQVLVTLHPSALLRMGEEDFPAAYAAWLDDLRAGSS
jgi:DNA polymerase